MAIQSAKRHAAAGSALHREEYWSVNPALSALYGDDQVVLDEYPNHGRLHWPIERWHQPTLLLLA